LAGGDPGDLQSTTGPFLFQLILIVALNQAAFIPDLFNPGLKVHKFIRKPPFRLQAIAIPPPYHFTMLSTPTEKRS
jgi:hypothetical protein